MPAIPSNPTLDQIEQYVLDLYRYQRDFARTMNTATKVDCERFGNVEVIAMGCIDERADIPGAFNALPPSFASILRHAAEFQFGEKWAGVKFQEALYEANITSGGKTLVFTSYHYCNADPDGSHHLACAAYGGDTNAAVLGTLHERDMINVEMYPTKKTAYAVAIGLETNTLGIFLHGESPEQAMRVSDLAGKSVVEIREAVRPFFPSLALDDTNDERLNVIAEIISENIYVQEQIAQERGGAKDDISRESIQHGGHLVVYGRSGISFQRNSALEAGPWTAELRTALTVMAGNLKRFKEQGEDGRFLVVCVTLNEHPDSHAYSRGYVDRKVAYFSSEVRALLNDPGFQESLKAKGLTLGEEEDAYRIIELRVNPHTLDAEEITSIKLPDRSMAITPFSDKAKM